MGFLTRTHLKERTHTECAGGLMVSNRKRNRSAEFAFTFVQIPLKIKYESISFSHSYWLNNSIE